MGRATQNFIARLRGLSLIGIGTLALAACTAAVPDAEKALSAASRKPDGVYGISPVALQLRASNKVNFSNIKVYSSVAGVQTPLATNFNTGYITGLTANTTYALKVHGVSPGGVEAVEPMNEYYSRTWIPFSFSTWNLSESSRDALNGSIYRVSWAYAPWAVTAAGDNALEGTMMRCYFVPSAQPDPFVPGAKVVDALVREGGFDISSAALGLSGFVRSGCEVLYIDGTKSTHLTTRVSNFAPTVSACPAAEVTVYDAANPYSCLTTTVAGASIDNTYSLQLDAANTCAFVHTTGNDLSGSPYASDLDLTPTQTCDLAYRLTGPGFTSDVMHTTIKVKNVQPVWETFPSAKVIREISPNDPAVPLLGAGVVDRATIAASLPGSPLENYRVVVMDGEITTNKERQGVNYNTQFGRYYLDTTTVNSCAKFGQVGHADASAPLGVADGIDPKTGAFTFLPLDFFYGSCDVDIYFDDGQAANHRSDTRHLTIMVQGYNDPPNLAPPQLSPSLSYACQGGGCFVGIDYDLGLQADVGGNNPTIRSINESANQELFLKTGNCISSDPTYLKVSFCQLDAQKNLILSFTPLGVPPAAPYPTPKILIRVSDNGNNSMISAKFPTFSGNSGPTDCLLGHDCGSYPNTNVDSATLEIPIKIAEFNLPIRPALIVSKAACLACHANIQGDFITDYGNSGTGSRFVNMFFKDDLTPGITGDNKWFTNRATHYSGTLALDSLTGSLFTKRALIKHDTPGQINQSKFLSDVTWWDQNNVEHPAGSMATINLVDFLRGKGFIAPHGVEGNPPTSTLRQPSYVGVGCFTGACRSFPDVNVTDVLPNGQPIEYLRIDAPTAEDIKAIALQAPADTGVKLIDWDKGGSDWAHSGPGIGALYRIPNSGATEPRPFSGLEIATKQPFQTVTNGQQPRNVPAYVRNTSGEILCYGDIVVKGNLFLSKPTFRTDERGCRIHVTGDIIFHSYNGYYSGGTFIPASGMTVNSPNGKHGVQITSASSVNFGMSQMQINNKLQPLRAMPDSALEFAKNIGVPAGTEPEIYGKGDEETFPPGFDGWDHGVVNYSKLMINAPVINSRYLGEIKGSVIADYALFRLQRLIFKYDDEAFDKQVPFPRLQTIFPKPRVIFDAGACSSNPKECENGSN